MSRPQPFRPPHPATNIGPTEGAVANNHASDLRTALYRVHVFDDRWSSDPDSAHATATALIDALQDALTHAVALYVLQQLTDLDP